ncbi:MAG TPA: transcriptional regulator [Bacteroidales bacterium]|nr:transcriptional regulator [Bacteroidales bacterium]HRZ49070.1 transcriptional regulator [Bacteroidales bacterium]
MEIKEVVLKTLAASGKPMKAGEIADASGIDKKEVEKGIKALVKEGKVDSPVRCFYGIKP